MTDTASASFTTGDQMPSPGAWRCEVTDNPVGTDTVMIGAPPCQCRGCRGALAASENEMLRAAAWHACLHYWNCDGNCNEYRGSMAALANTIGYNDPAIDADISAALSA